MPARIDQRSSERTPQKIDLRMPVRILGIAAILFVWILFTDEGALALAVVERMLDTISGASL